MLRMFQNSRPADAKSYFSTADYYTEGQELVGVWRGRAAHMMGLEGNIKQADWDALCDNVHPLTGDQLTARTRSDRRVGYDMNFHVPKSVSLLYAETKDERLLDAFREAVNGTMQDIEREMQTRVRKDGKNADRTTGNMVWGEFVHFTSRPVNGVPDPHLHSHCFVFNTTWDNTERQWKAGQFGNLKRDAPYFEAVFHTRLAHRLHELGLPIERGKHGWELGGIARDTIEKFSRRTQEVNEREKEVLAWLKEKKGIELDHLSPEARAQLGAESRKLKNKGLTFPELQAAWHDRMTPEEQDALTALTQKLGGDAEPIDSTAAAVRAVDYAISHSFERKSVIDERRLLAEALKHGVGQATVEDVKHAMAASDVITAERHGRRMATTREVLAEEQKLIAFARDGRGTCAPFAASCDQFQRDWLSDEQKQAVRHIVGSRDRVTILRGASGAGKTSLLQEAVAAIEASGTNVVALAPSANASRKTLRDAGFAEADTVARFLVDEKLQEKARGQLIWIDEAGLLGSRTMSAVFKAADKLDSRILLSGDRKQHGAVERGAALKLLEDEAGVKPAEVKEIQRQAGAYKEAVKAMGEGRIAEGFKRLDELGWVREIADGERYRVMADDYVKVVSDGNTALVVSPTHAEGARITAEIRQALKAVADQARKAEPTKKPPAWAIDGKEQLFTVLQGKGLTEAERGEKVNYEPGDVLQFHQNAKGFTRGDRLVVKASQPLPLDQAKRFEVFRTGSLELASGDWVRITHNGTTADGRHKLDNGSLYKVNRFDDDGNIVLANGWTVFKGFGHLAHGYVVTSHSSQSRTVDETLVGQATESFPASSEEQIYVSASRSRKRVVIYTDNKDALREAIQQSDERLSATELVAEAMRRSILRRPPERTIDVEPQPKKERELAYGN